MNAQEICEVAQQGEGFFAERWAINGDGEKRNRIASFAYSPTRAGAEKAIRSYQAAVGPVARAILGSPNFFSGGEVAGAFQREAPFDVDRLEAAAIAAAEVDHPRAQDTAGSLRRRVTDLREGQHDRYLAFYAGVRQTSSRPGAVGYAGEGIVTFANGTQFKVVGHESGGSIYRSGSWWDGHIEWIPL